VLAPSLVLRIQKFTTPPAPAAFHRRFAGTAQAAGTDMPMVTPMTRTSRIVGLLFALIVVTVVVFVATDGQPETLVRELDDLRRRYVR
jgi:hypothetical protein